MATVATLLARSARMLGVLASNTSMSSNEAADGLIAYNAMLGVWANDGLMAYARREESLTLVGSDASYTIGSGGDLNTTRPVEIITVWMEGYPPLLPLTDEEYAAIIDKTATSDVPTHYNYKASMSTGTLYLYPTPSAAATLKILTRVPLTAFSATSDTVTLPPGWEEAIATNGAIALSAEYQVAVPAAVAKLAKESLKAIKRANAQPIKADSGLIGVVGRPNAGNITTDA